jgi:hypothetical protein
MPQRREAQMARHEIQLGDVTITPRVVRGHLESLGDVRVNGTRLRNPANRFLPWFDTYEGDVFRRFKLVAIESKGRRVIIRTKALSDPDTLFQERRDASGDPCVRPQSWDGAPLDADFRVVLEPAHATIDGRRFAGFRYWFEFSSRRVRIHRIADRQTWEIGGDLGDVSVVCRNLFDKPRKKISRAGTYSTVGLDNWAQLLPGNLWARWTLLPSFDMQYGRSGTMVAWFDRVSLIRSVIESMRGEDWVRYVDLHYFEQTGSVATNPKTVLFCPDRLDDTEAMNLWTRVSDAERDKACAQFGIVQRPPAVTFSENVWRNFRFDRTYDHVVNTAARFGAEHVFIDAVWENGQSLREFLESRIPEKQRRGTVYEKFLHQNMCCTLDFKVADVFGGEKGLKALCTRAAKQGIKVLSWMSAHYTPNTALQEERDLGHGLAGIFAAKESGRHPDTGYPSACWTANLNTPVYDRMRDQILGTCRRTGLAGFLWDSVSNLGWWQVDYSNGTMRPQFDRMAALYGELTRAGLYITPEAIVTFSNSSCCGLHGGNVYAGDLLGYSYNTVISLQYGTGRTHEDQDQLGTILKGSKPVDELFQCIAHKRVPHMALHRIPAREWDAEAFEFIRGLIATYRQNCDTMHTRTVLKGNAGVEWEAPSGERLLFSFKRQKIDEDAIDLRTGEPAARREVAKNAVYRMAGRGC